MKNIEVKVLTESHECPAGMMMFLAKLTQRGQKINNMNDLLELYNKSMENHKSALQVANLPHGTIKRFTPITIAVVGASRRFLAQARTHQVGINYMSGSLQYSDYSESNSFVIPYALLEKDSIENTHKYTTLYLNQCKHAMELYKYFSTHSDNDTAGYISPQGLRNVLVMQGNHEAWMNFIKTRSCNRNSNETQYVTLKIWEALLNTNDGDEMFHYAGPDCLYGCCREGKFCCGNTMKHILEEHEKTNIAIPTLILKEKWPLLYK